MSEDRNQGDNYNLDKHRGTSADESISAITKRTQQALADKEREQRKLGRHGGDRKSEEVKNQHSDSKVDKVYGETADYLLDRIERDFPETYQDVKDFSHLQHGTFIVCHVLAWLLRTKTD